MHILIVEDSRNRIRKFYDLLGHHQLTAVNFVEGAIQNLMNQFFDVVFLDYDLREGHSKVEELVSYWIENEKDTHYFKYQKAKPIVVIHSLNTTGAIFMSDQLNGISIEAHRIEFFDLIRMPLSQLSEKIKLDLGNI